MPNLHYNGIYIYIYVDESNLSKSKCFDRQKAASYNMIAIGASAGGAMLRVSVRLSVRLSCPITHNQGFVEQKYINIS